MIGRRLRQGDFQYPVAVLSFHFTGVHIAYVETALAGHLPPLPAEVVLAILFLVRFLLNGDGKVAVV